LIARDTPSCTASASYHQWNLRHLISISQFVKYQLHWKFFPQKFPLRIIIFANKNNWQFQSIARLKTSCNMPCLAAPSRKSDAALSSAFVFFGERKTHTNTDLGALQFLATKFNVRSKKCVLPPFPFARTRGCRIIQPYKHWR
jgi:hypothetical protein